jgi:hypothetical protein
VPVPAEAARPGAPGPTPVAVGIWIADISRIDSAEQTFTANLVVVIGWHDPSLPQGHPNGARYDLADVWHPNWLITNATTNLQRTFPEVVDVSADGSVTYRQRLIGTFAQTLDLRKFPFDSAIFRIHFVVVGQTPEELQFVAHTATSGVPNGVGIAAHLTMQDWKVSDLRATALPYRDVPGHDMADYALLLIVIMPWAAFWLDIGIASTQASISVTSMLTLIAYRSAVGSETPRLPYLTNLDAFILVSSILVLLTLIEVIVTSTLVSHGRTELARKINRHCRYGFPAAFFAVSAATLLLR